MRWTKNGPTAIESGDLRISKAYLDGCPMYCLHYQRGEAIKFSEDVEELKQMAEEKQGGK